MPDSKVTPLSYQLLKELKAHMEMIADGVEVCAELSTTERDITPSADTSGHSVIEAKVTFTTHYRCKITERKKGPQTEMELPEDNAANDEPEAE